MIRKENTLVMKAVALCFKPRLKPEEALIYCNLGRTQFAKRCEEEGITKNSKGYFEREDLDKITGGQIEKAPTMKMREIA